MLTELATQIIPETQRLIVLTRLEAAGGPWEAMELRLYQLPTTVPPDDVLLADLTEADFTGYAAEAPVILLGPAIAPDGSAYFVASTVLFTRTAGAVSNTIYGAYLVNTAGTALVAVFPFVTPVGMVNTGDAIPIAPQLHYSGD